jgi:hypothetical protein
VRAGRYFNPVHRMPGDIAEPEGPARRIPDGGLPEFASNIGQCFEFQHGRSSLFAIRLAISDARSPTKFEVALLSWKMIEIKCLNGFSRGPLNNADI